MLDNNGRQQYSTKIFYNKIIQHGQQQFLTTCSTTMVNKVVQLHVRQHVWKTVRQKVRQQWSNDKYLVGNVWSNQDVQLSKRNYNIQTLPKEILLSKWFKTLLNMCKVFRGPFHQHFTRAFFVRKSSERLFCRYA